FGSHRSVGNDNIVANSFYPDGSTGIYDQRVRNYTLRLTWQVSPRNKITAYDDYQTKYVGHLFTSGADVLLAAARRPPVLKYTDAIKWTSTVSNKLVFDVGWGTSVNAYREGYQPGIQRTPFTPEWYANASRVDINRNTTNLAAPPELGTYNFRYMLISSMNYVTGSPPRSDERRSWPLRSGLVDAQTADDQPRSPVGVLQFVDRADGGRGGAVRTRPLVLGGAERTELEEHRAADRRGVRPHRRRE